MRDDIITKIGSLLRDVLPDEADTITLDGEADEAYSRVAFNMRRPDDTRFRFDSTAMPEQTHEISMLLIDLWEDNDDAGGDPWHGIVMTVGRDGAPDVAFSPDFPTGPAAPADDDEDEEDDELPETDEIIQDLAEILRELLPDEGAEIVLDSEMDDDYASHTFTVRRPDGTTFPVDWDTAPESIEEVGPLIFDLWDATVEDGDAPWSGVTMTLRRDDTFDLTFFDEPSPEG